MQTLLTTSEKVKFILHTRCKTIEISKSDIAKSFDSHIWKQLSYDVSFVSNESDGLVEFHLHCKIWNENKVSNLLIKPGELRKHDLNLPQIKIFKKLVCQGTIVSDFHNENDCMDNIISHCNEYFSSLLISQLEFRYPLVFSKVARARLQEQEHSIGALSYALNSTSELMPYLILLIEKESTNTTAYQLINHRKSKWPCLVRLMKKRSKFS